MPSSFNLSDIGRIPSPGDNLAIAIRRLEKGTQVVSNGAVFELNNTVLEGHRFAVQPIPRGGQLLSWGLPFGLAIRDIVPGAYACNASILATLRDRSIDFELPTEPNFEDHIEPYNLDESRFRPGVQVPLHATPRTFLGYRRTRRPRGWDAQLHRLARHHVANRQLCEAARSAAEGRGPGVSEH